MFLVVAASLVVALIALGSIVGILTDRLWFKEAHYSQVFTTMIWTRVVLFLVVGLFVGGLVAASGWLAYRTRPLLRPRSAEQQVLDRYRIALSPRIGMWIGLFAGFVGLLAAMSGQGHWQTWLLYANGGKFGVKDPQFGTDIGWYVFSYPFYRYVLGVAFTAVFLALLIALALHYVFGGVRLQGEGDRMTTAARAHITALVAAFVLLKAAAYWLDQRGLVLGHNTGVNVWGAGYTDVTALLPAKQILAWISLIVAVAVLVFSNAFVRNLQWTGMALGLLVLSAIAIGGIYPFAVQRLSVRPNPLQKEKPYIARSIAATRAAFGLDNIVQTDYAATNQTPPASLVSQPDGPTVANLRLLDPAVVADTFNVLQRARGVYAFGDKLDIDRYTDSAGSTKEYVAGVREIDYASETGRGWNWQNAHTIYTHGDGFVAAPADRTVCGGQPYFASGVLADEKGATPTTQNGERCATASDAFPVKQDGIYYGEGMDAYAVVGQPAGGTPAEYDGPTTGNSDSYVTYQGSGGVKVGSYWTRMLYAYQFKEPNFLISSVFNDDSKLLYVRDPRARVEKIAPFLTIDGDPYPAVVDGHITWILDGYTTASTYPYSNQVDLATATSDAQVGTGEAKQADRSINYLRNSVKATVDAYDGTVTLYAFGGADPVRDAWNKAFGGKLIQPEATISPALRAHFRYPEDQLKVQRELLTRYHVTDPQTFYGAQDNWQVPTDPAHAGSSLKQPPYYVLAAMPGDTKPTFMLTSAMNRSGGAQNLASVITGSYDADGKPVLSVLELPNSATQQGPVQMQQLMQASGRQELALLNGNGSTLVYANLLSLPYENGILYMQPLYVQSGTGYPILKSMLLAYGSTQVYVETTDIAVGLKALLDKAKTGVSPPVTNPQVPPLTGGSAALDAAIQHINAALADVKAAGGDLTKLAAALQKLQNAINEYNSAKGSAPPVPTPSASGSPAK
jgi:uncharacterized protein